MDTGRKSILFNVAWLINKNVSEKWHLRHIAGTGPWKNRGRDGGDSSEGQH